MIHDAVMLDDGVTPHPVRSALVQFCTEQGVGFFDINGTWGVVVKKEKNAAAAARETLVSPATSETDSEIGRLSSNN